MQEPRRGAHLGRHVGGLAYAHGPRLAHPLTHGRAGHVVADHGKPVGQLVDLAHPRQARVIDLAHALPHVAVRDLDREVLPDKKSALAVAATSITRASHELRHAARAAPELTHDLVRVVGVERSKDLLVLHA